MATPPSRTPRCTRFSTAARPDQSRHSVHVERSRPNVSTSDPRKAAPKAAPPLDLDALFGAARHALTPGGLFAFSVEALDEALCYGWIDGVRRSLDEDSFTQRFTPRKARSNWSSVNIKRVNELIAAGFPVSLPLWSFALAETPTRPLVG